MKSPCLNLNKVAIIVLRTATIFRRNNKKENHQINRFRYPLGVGDQKQATQASTAENGKNYQDYLNLSYCFYFATLKLLPLGGFLNCNSKQCDKNLNAPFFSLIFWLQLGANIRDLRLLLSQGVLLIYHILLCRSNRQNCRNNNPLDSP